jgi:hypothetical protein
MKKISFNAASGLPLIVIGLTACVASPPPYMDANFGGAVEMAKGQQTMNPDASLNTHAVEGIDGQAGDASFDSYRDSFINPKSAPRGSGLNIGTSGGGSSSGGR